MYKRLSKFCRIIITLFMISILLCGCSYKFGYSNSSSKNEMKASFSSSLTDTKETTIELKKGETITFFYDITIKSGTLSAVFEDSSGNELLIFDPNTDGTKEITVDKDDSYDIRIEAEEAGGSYKFKWEIN